MDVHWDVLWILAAVPDQLAEASGLKKGPDDLPFFF